LNLTSYITIINKHVENIWTPFNFHPRGFGCLKPIRTTSGDGHQIASYFALKISQGDISPIPAWQSSLRSELVALRTSWRTNSWTYLIFPKVFSPCMLLDLFQVAFSPQPRSKVRKHSGVAMITSFPLLVAEPCSWTKSSNGNRPKYKWNNDQPGITIPHFQGWEINSIFKSPNINPKQKRKTKTATLQTYNIKHSHRNP